MCRTTLLSTPTSSQTCAVKSSGSRRKWRISRAASSTRSGRTSATSRVSLSPRLLAREAKALSHLCDLLLPHCSGGAGPLQPAEPGRDGPAEGAASGGLPSADGDPEEPPGAGEQQHGDSDRHLQTAADHRRVSVLSDFRS